MFRGPLGVVQLIIGLAIVVIVLIAVRVKTGKPWPVILSSPDWLSRHVAIATVVVMFVIY